MINRIKTFFGQNGMTTVNTTENTDAFGNVINSHSMITNLNNGQASTSYVNTTQNTDYAGNISSNSVMTDMSNGQVHQSFDNTNQFGNTTTSHDFGNITGNGFSSMTTNVNQIGNDQIVGATTGNIDGSNFYETMIGGMTLQDHFHAMTSGNIDNSNFAENIDISGMDNNAFDNAFDNPFDNNLDIDYNDWDFS